VPRSALAVAEVITLGVDTHKDIHVAVALDNLGRRLGTLSVPTIPAGYKELVAWARGFGALERAGVEGTGSFGAGLTRFLQAEGVEVFEVIRPRRRLIPSTPRQRPAQYWQAPRPECPKAPTAKWR
jgi:hypothetical protein